MKRINYIYLSCICILLFSGNISCKKFLEEKSDKKLIVPSTIEDFQGLLNDLVVMNQATPSLGEVSADDYFLLDNTYNGRIERQRNQYVWATYDKPVNEDWSSSYRPVYVSNLCLEGIAKIKTNEQNSLAWKNVKGSALFYRAYHFLQLVWIFSKAYDPVTAAQDYGIVLRLKSDFNIPSVRSTVQESYFQIIEDARKSIDLLPLLPQHPSRPSKAAAFGLLARTFLTMNQYDSAYKYSNLCLSVKKDLIDFNALDLNRSFTFDPFNEEIIFYSVMNSSNTLHGASFGNIDSSLFEKYSEFDLRKKGYFNLNSRHYQDFKGSYEPQRNRFFTGIATDEMFLIRAESNARLNNLNEALQDLNTLIKKRYQSGTFLPQESSIQAEVIQLIMKERRKELLMRGLRWPDIKRLNKLGYEIQLKRYIESQEYILPPNDPRYALSLPWELVENYNLPQN